MQAEAAGAAPQPVPALDEKTQGWIGEDGASSEAV